jgi:hypothetical protein
MANMLEKDHTRILNELTAYANKHWNFGFRWKKAQ